MTTLTAFYDLQHGPVSYDFVTWLIQARLIANREQCDRLHVVIVPYEGGLGGFARHWGEHDEHATYWRLWHIVIASCPLVRASVTVADSREQAGKIYDDGYPYQWWPDGKAHFMGPLVDASRKGEPIPKLCATEQAKRYMQESLRGFERPIATLTVRNQTTDTARNSQRAEWDRLSDWLTGRGYDVIRIDDTNRALSQGRGFAELDPDLRLALYERAEVNVIGNNGPQELLKFSNAPYTIFGLALTDGWKEHWRKYFHMEPGEHVPWARENQKMVYLPDTFENMRACFT